MITQNAPSFPETSAPSRDREEPVERNSLQLYLQEIGKTPLLTLAEEVQLAGRIQKGDLAARNHMVQANLRLVVKIALDYRDFGLPLLDLISEGNLGLLKAVDRYDPTKGGKLSTYAAWWIKHSMQRALANQSKTIRLPVHVVAKISQMRKTARVLTESLGRDPTDEELAAELRIPVRKVTHLKSVAVHPASLDAPLGDTTDSSSLGEIVADENAHSPFEDFRDKSVLADLKSVVDSLDPREAEILRLRFGLDGKKELTLAEVGKKFKVTRERIRQLQQLALKQVRRLMEQRDAQHTEDEESPADRDEIRAQVREFIESPAGRSAAA